MPFAKRRGAAIAVRRPITASPKFVRLQTRVTNIAKRTKHTAQRNEQTLLTLVGAAAPALVQRFTGKSLPTFGGIDPSLLYGGLAIVVGSQMKGKSRERLMAVGTGIAAPGLARAIATGSVKVSGDDDVSGDDEISGDDDVGEDI